MFIGIVLITLTEVRRPNLKLEDISPWVLDSIEVHKTD